MPDTTELEVPAKYPPDWRDWINEFPTVKSVALFCVAAWITTSLIMAVAGLYGYFYELEPKPGILNVLSTWLDALNWLTAAAVFGVVGKRATEKPEVIRAEGEVKAAAIAAAQPGGAVTLNVSSVDPLGAPAIPPAAGSVSPQPVTDLEEIPGEGD